ncbi:hypothetical protein DFQ26_001799, partial [Actinomortierella ambigua]
SGFVSATPLRIMVDDQNQQASILSDNTVDTGHTSTDASSLSSQPSPRPEGGTDPVAEEVIEHISTRELLLQQQPQQQQQQQQPRYNQDTQPRDEEVHQEELLSSSLPSGDMDSSCYTPPTPSSSRFANGAHDSKHTSPQSNYTTEKVALSGPKSPSGSRSSIAKDISAPYREHQLLPEPPIDENLYGLGIPDCWRTAVWSYLITNRGRDADMDIKLREAYPRLCAKPSLEEEQIDLDIPRTMHGHIMFKARYGSGQCALFNVLKAYSNYDRQVGYCQGMASVVATMLTFFDEEKTFVLLETMGITTASYASRWYITLFAAGVVPYRTLLRIWDVLFLEGFEWMYFVAIALLKYHEARLVQNNFEQTMEMLNARMNIEEDDRLIKIARKMHRRAQRSNIVARLKGQYVERERAAKSAHDDGSK